MPRRPRLHVPGGHYDVMPRGNHREHCSPPQPIGTLNDIVAEVIARPNGARARWMTNHLHALIHVADRPVREAADVQFARFCLPQALS